MGKGVSLPWAEQLGYPCGRKAGCTQFIRALVKQKSPPAKVRKRKEATASPEAVLGFFPCPWELDWSKTKQVFLGVTNPMQRCTDQQCPALALEHTNRFVQRTQHLLRETQTSPGRVGGWAGTCGSGTKVTGRMAAMSNQTVLRNITAPGRQSQAWTCFSFCTFSHVYSPLPCTHPMLCSVSSFPGLVQALATAPDSSGSLLGTGNCQASWPWSARGCSLAPGHGSGVWWQSFPRRNSPWTRLQGALELCPHPSLPPSPPFLQPAMPS